MRRGAVKQSALQAVMKTTVSLAFAALLCVPPLLQSQSASPTSPQDVPKQQPPGTNNPDISKQRRPAPDPPPGNTPDSKSPDVPHQEPGTDNPDVGKQRAGDKTAPDKGATTPPTSKKKAKGKKQ